MGDGNCFKLTPSSGLLAPGASATLQAVFTAAGNATFREALRFHVNGLDPREDVDLLRCVVVCVVAGCARGSGLLCGLD